MDPKLWFWSAALADLAAVVGFTIVGVRRARRGAYAAHRRSMLFAVAGVALFLIAYGFKRSLVGSEDLSVWSDVARWNLWIHESFVTTMLLAGGVALFFGRKLRRTRLVLATPDAPSPDAALRRRHRRAGWTAVVCAALGLATAFGIWAGMLARSAG